MLGRKVLLCLQEGKHRIAEGGDPRALFLILMDLVSFRSECLQGLSSPRRKHTRGGRHDATTGLRRLSWACVGPHPRHVEVPKLGGLIEAVAASHSHSHSNAGSEPHLRPTPQFMATPDP